MAGDVFGNGMLRSEHTKLVAAFNHLHVFLDPDPDPAASFAERARLAALPRSSWADYDPSVISAGGGVYERTRKAIPVSDQVREVLGIDDGVTELTPPELISAILRAPVDLVWNGGIGTYVKASFERNEDVGDKANDAVRVDGGQVRAKIAGEGGNLGWTQHGRIEYAMAGGRINTDFIDNSAGVDTSDHEVNIKILLQPAVKAGELDADAGAQRRLEQSPGRRRAAGGRPGRGERVVDAGAGGVRASGSRVGGPAEQRGDGPADRRGAGPHPARVRDAAGVHEDPALRARHRLHAARRPLPRGPAVDVFPQAASGTVR
jgi:hypothetical protein